VFLRSLTFLAFVTFAGAASDSANAAMTALPSPELSQIQLADGGCGAGWRRSLFGGCVRVNKPRFTCPHGLYKTPAPTASGYRCTYWHD
jgi:hypothetical protein